MSPDPHPELLRLLVRTLTYETRTTGLGVLPLRAAAKRLGKISSVTDEEIRSIVVENPDRVRLYDDEDDGALLVLSDALS